MTIKQYRVVEFAPGAWIVKKPDGSTMHNDADKEAIFTNPDFVDEYVRQLNENLKGDMLKLALDLLAEWAYAVETQGSGWDDWDEHYKDVRWRPGPLREAIDERLAALAKAEGKVIDLASKEAP